MSTRRVRWFFASLLAASVLPLSMTPSARAQDDSDAGAPDASEPPAAEPASAPPAETPPAENVEASAPVDQAAVDALLAGAASEATVLESDAPSIHIYGFADFNVSRPYLSDDSPFRDLTAKSAFTIGNVNLYVAANLTHGFSSLIEVRLSYMPSGTNDPSGKVVTTYALDPANYGRSERWGGIVLQRVQLDYSYNSLLNVRVGQFLTPYGIWNVDHGSPTVIPVFKPYPIGNAYFPERQIGAEVFGSHLVKNTTLGYHLTISNGRGDVETADFDKNKALGGRLFLATDALGSLKLGLSAYGGRATLDTTIGLGASGEIAQTSANAYQELAFAGDVLWEWKNLRLQGEGIASQIRYTEEGRKLNTTLLGTPLGLVADHVAWAWYGLIGYRLPWLGTMPFFLVDQFHQAPGGTGPASSFSIGNEAIGYNVGLNVRPVPSVVLKCQVSVVRGPSENADLTLVGGQAAWAF